VDEWLIIDGGQDLSPTIRAELATLGAEIELRIVEDADPDIGSLANSAVRRLVMRAGDGSADCLDLVCRALQASPQLEIVICSDRLDRIDGPTSLATGVCIVSGPREAATVGSPEAQPSSRNDDRSPPRPNIVDVVRIVSHSGKTRVLEVDGPYGRGALGFVDGILTHASTGHLIGSDAFFQMVLWDESTFRSVVSTRYLECEVNISERTAELLQEAVKLQKALEGDVLEASQPIEAALDAGGCLGGVVQWWERASEGERPIVRVLVAYPPETPCKCVRSFTEQVATHVKPVKRWVSEPKIGPTFVRLHSENGTILNLTFIAMKPSNRFFFETFAWSSETVVICQSGESSGAEPWRDWVPEGVRVVVSEESVAGNPVNCPALQRLVEDDG